jgi:type IV pilus assembly protein PilM
VNDYLHDTLQWYTQGGVLDLMSFSDLFSFTTTPRGPERAVGVDIGSSSIKVVELEDRKGVPTLATYGELQCGPYDAKDVGHALTLAVEKEQQALVDVLRESAVQAKAAVVSIPLSESFVTVMSFAAKAQEDLSPRIRVEARKYIPIQLSEVTLDWAEVGQASTKDNHRQVLVAAIQNSALNRFRSLSEFVGFNEPPFEIECFSVLRSLPQDAPEHCLCLDIGAATAKLYFVRSGLLQRMHRVRAGGEAVTTALAEMRGLSFSAAETLKRFPDPEAERDVEKAHQKALERSLREFRQVMDEYEKSQGVTITKVYLSGGVALAVGIRSQVQLALEKDTQLAEPFSRVAYPAFMEDLLGSLGPSFAVALGAALRVFE